MKKNLPNLALAFMASSMISSCSTNQISASQRKVEAQNSKEIAAASFVKMNDGTVKVYQSLKLVTGIFTTPHLLADGKFKIEPSSITAYQNNDHYAISQSMIAKGRKSYVAIETLPGFAVRVAKGKLNVYCKKFYNGRAAVDEFFLQSGNEGEILSYTPDLLKTMIKDNHEALTFFTTQKEKDIAKKLQATADMYNQSQFMSKN